MCPAEEARILRIIELEKLDKPDRQPTDMSGLKSKNIDAVLIDCHHSGIAGDMMLGALIDLGADPETIRDEVARCTEEEGHVEVSISQVKRASIMCTKVDLEIEASGHHVHMRECMGRASDDWVKERSLEVLNTLERAEAAVHSEKHGTHPHLHEVGRLDAVGDIVGSIAAWRDLGLDSARVYSTRVALGGGDVQFSHGDFPVPAPATLEILRGVPVRAGGERELTTPTGAALLVNLTEVFSDSIDITPVAIGMGAGSDMGDFLNATRVVAGTHGVRGVDFVDVIETNIDDITPEQLAHCSGRVMEEGALDFTVAPVTMKKGRQGTLIRVIVDPEKSDAICDTLLRETGSLGARIHRGVERRKLAREVTEVSFQLAGQKRRARVKVARTQSGDLVSAKPEYDDVAALCRETGLAFPVVQGAIMEAAISAGITR